MDYMDSKWWQAMKKKVKDGLFFIPDGDGNGSLHLGSGDPLPELGLAQGGIVPPSQPIGTCLGLPIKGKLKFSFGFHESCELWGLPNSGPATMNGSSGVRGKFAPKKTRFVLGAQAHRALVALNALASEVADGRHR